MFKDLNTPVFLVEAEGLSFKALAELANIIDGEEIQYFGTASQSYPALYAHIEREEFALILSSLEMPPIQYGDRVYDTWLFYPEKNKLALDSYNSICISDERIADLDSQLLNPKEYLVLE